MYAAIVALLPFLVPTLASPIARREYNQLLINPQSGLCLSIDKDPAAPYANGQKVVAVECQDDTESWEISRGSGSVFVTGTNFVLDAGDNPANNGVVKIWESFPGLYQQTWYYTEDDRIAITGGNQCLDLGPDGPQTYQCTTGNTNQVWVAQDPPSSTTLLAGPTSVSVIADPTVTPAAAVTTAA